MKSHDTHEELQRAEAAAAMLGVSSATLWRLVRAGRLPVVRVLGRPRFRTSDLQALAAGTTDQPGC